MFIYTCLYTILLLSLLVVSLVFSLCTGSFFLQKKSETIQEKHSQQYMDCSHLK